MNMIALERRLARLEERRGIKAPKPIIIMHDACFPRGKEACSINGDLVPRLPGEPFDQYKARAIEAVMSMPAPAGSPSKILHIAC